MLVLQLRKKKYQYKEKCEYKNNIDLWSLTSGGHAFLVSLLHSIEVQLSKSTLPRSQSVGESWDQKVQILKDKYRYKNTQRHKNTNTKDAIEVQL